MTKKQDVVFLVGVAAVMLVAAAGASMLVVAAWETGGFVQQGVTAVADAIGGNHATLVAFAGALVGTLALVFVADSAKTVQGVLFLGVVLPSFYLTLLYFDLWTIEVARYPGAVVVGVLLGIGVSLVGTRIEPGGGGLVPAIREFPSAGRTLYTLTVLAVVVATVQTLVAGVPESATVAGVGGVGLLVLGVVSGVVLSVGVGVFTAYREFKNIVVFSPTPEEEANVVGGLYGEAGDLYGAQPLASQAALLTVRNLTAKSELEPFDREARFQFRPDGWLARTVEVGSTGVFVDRLFDEDVDEMVAEASRGTAASFLRQQIRRLGPALLPVVVVDYLTTDSPDPVAQVRAADVLLFVAPLETARQTEPSSDLMEKYDRIANAYVGSDKTVYLVVTDCHDAVDELEDSHFDSLDEFVTYGLLPQPPACEVLPVYRPGEQPDSYGDSDELVGGKAVLERVT